MKVCLDHEIFPLDTWYRFIDASLRFRWFGGIQAPQRRRERREGAETESLHRRHITRPTRPAVFRGNAAIIRTDHFLRFKAPDMIGAVDIVLGPCRETIKHKVFLRAQLTAEWGLDGCCGHDGFAVWLFLAH